MVTSNYSDQGESRALDNIQQMITRAAAVTGQQSTKENGHSIDLGFLFIIVSPTPMYVHLIQFF